MKNIIWNKLKFIKLFLTFLLNKYIYDNVRLTSVKFMLTELI